MSDLISFINQADLKDLIVHIAVFYVVFNGALSVGDSTGILCALCVWTQKSCADM